MIVVHPAASRSVAEEGWLSSRRSLPAQLFAGLPRAPRVPLLAVVEDLVRPGKGFGAHDHHDMEILSYVRDGALLHRDSLGNEAVIRPGEIQRMSAGAGIRHSEMNASAIDAVSFVQVWIMPATRGTPPGYAQRRFDPAVALVHLAGPSMDALVTVQQAADLWRVAPPAGEALILPGQARPFGWLHLLSGAASVGDVRLTAGDAVALVDDGDTRFAALQPGTEALLFRFEATPAA